MEELKEFDEFDEEMPCQECGHTCSESVWNGECASCEVYHTHGSCCVCGAEVEEDEVYCLRCDKLVYDAQVEKMETGETKNE